MDGISKKSASSRPSITQTMEGEYDPDDSGTDIEVRKFNVEEYEEVYTWLTSFQITEVEIPLRNIDPAHRNKLME